MPLRPETKTKTRPIWVERDDCQELIRDGQVIGRIYQGPDDYTAIKVAGVALQLGWFPTERDAMRAVESHWL